MTTLISNRIQKLQEIQKIEAGFWMGTFSAKWEQAQAELIELFRRQTSGENKNHERTIYG